MDAFAGVEDMQLLSSYIQECRNYMLPRVFLVYGTLRFCTAISFPCVTSLGHGSQNEFRALTDWPQLH